MNNKVETYKNNIMSLIDKAERKVSKLSSKEDYIEKTIAYIKKRPVPEHMDYLDGVTGQIANLYVYKVNLAVAKAKKELYLYFIEDLLALDEDNDKTNGA